MKLFKQHLKVLIWNRKLGALIFFITGLYTLLPLFLSVRSQTNPWLYALNIPLVTGISLAVYIAQTQRELMSKLSCFLFPGFSRNLWAVHLSTLLGLGVSTFILGYYLPLLDSVTFHSWFPSLNLSLLTMGCYAVTILVIFQFRYSASLWTGLHFPYYFYLLFGRFGHIQPYQSFLESQYLPWACILLIFGIFKLLTSMNLPRQLSEQPFLSIMQLHRADKVQQFKNRNSAFKTPKDQSRRPLKNLMDTCLEKACQWRYSGNESRAVFWDTHYLALITGIPRNFLGLWSYIFFMAPFVFIIGYADSMRSCDSAMVGWYSAFPFMFATFPILGFHYLRISPLGLPRDRAATEKAGYVYTGWIILAVVLFSVLMFAAMHFLGAVMPEYETASRVWSYHPPSRFHTPFLPLLVLPVVLLIYILWPRSSSQMILSGAAMQVFLFFNFMISNGEQGWLTMVVLGVSLASWIALPFLWRRELRLHG